MKESNGEKKIINIKIKIGEIEFDFGKIANRIQ